MPSGLPASAPHPEGHQPIALGRWRTRNVCASPGCCSQQVTQAGEEVDVTADGIAFQLLDGRQAAPHAEELQALHAEVRADLPYGGPDDAALFAGRSEEHTSEQSRQYLVC